MNKNKNRNPIVNTMRFEFAHGKQPRGFGSWAFSFGLAAPTDYLFWVHQSNYSTARKLAVQHGRSMGASIVEVQS